MATLENVQGASLVADLAPVGQAIGDVFRSQNVRQAQQQIFQPGATQEQMSQGLLTIGRINPQLAQFTLSVLERGDKLEIRKLRDESIRARNQALALQKIKDPGKQMTALLDMASEKALLGEDPSEELRLADMSPEQRKLELDTDVLTGDALLGITTERPEFQLAVGVDGQVVQVDQAGKQSAVPRIQAANTAVGKINQDFTLGRINEVQQKALIKQEIAKSPDRGGARFSKSPPFPLRLPDGTNATVTTVLDNRSGEVQNIVTPVKGEFLSRVGQTPQERAALKVGTAGGVAEAQREVQRVTAAPIAAETRRGTATESRAQENISGALLAAGALPQLQRSLSLLEEVGTGGVGLERAGRAIRRITGQETADEGELSFNLSKNVMKQLKPTFGAAFTEREGALLTQIEAGITKSPAGNKRLLRQAIQITRTAIERGQRAALNRGDQEALRDISEALNIDLSPEGLADIPTTGPTVPAPTTALEDFNKAFPAGRFSVKRKQ